MSSRPKSSCTFIGPLWVLFTGRVPPFERCCEEHDGGYRVREIELAAEQGDLHWYIRSVLEPERSCYFQELALAVLEGWGREFCDMKFRQCIEASYERETWWDEVCHWFVRRFGWLFWKRKKMTINPA